MLLDRLLNIITYSVWSLFLVIVVFSFVRNLLRAGVRTAFRKLFSLHLFWIPLIVAVVLTGFNWSMVFIEPNKVGVIVSILRVEGYRDRPFRSGLKWIVPLFEEVHIYPLYWQTYTMSSKPLEGEKRGDDSIAARTSDGQEVMLDCSVIFRVNPEDAIRIHIEWQDRYLDDFFRPLMRGIIRTQVSQYTVDEVNSYKRLDLENDLDEMLRQALQDKGFVLDRFLLRNIAFSPEYAAAVEMKQIALQQATQKKHEAEQIRRLAEGEASRIEIIAEAEANAVEVKAQAEANALKMIADALSFSDDLLVYRYIDKLGPGIKVMLIPSENPLLLPIPDLTDMDSLDLTEGSDASTEVEDEAPSPAPTVEPTPTAEP